MTAVGVVPIPAEEAWLPRLLRLLWRPRNWRPSERLGAGPLGVASEVEGLLAGKTRLD